MIKLIGITLLLCILSSQCFGEYRVYQYYVRSKIQNLTNPPAEIVTTTLNPTDYIAYHGGRESIEINFLRSWQCMGNTSKEEPCTLGDGKELKELGVKQ